MRSSIANLSSESFAQPPPAHTRTASTERPVIAASRRDKLRATEHARNRRNRCCGQRSCELERCQICRSKPIAFQVAPEPSARHEGRAGHNAAAVISAKLNAGQL